jgi:hypothetical protein
LLVSKHQHFLSKGQGRIEFAIDALIDITQNMVVRGDDGWEYHLFQDEIEVLTPTPLDKAFGISCSLVLFHQSTPQPGGGWSQSH